ncbi:MAG: orotate phosphoribosyltransferase [Fidelibacterota bacterium]|nr:MAG: orotate phosphoribosyltransferase [Candidatus Neomarinimicrobiota bacterium]
MDFDLLNTLQQSGALLEGHFQLTSGKHSGRYIEKFRLLEQPRALDEVAQAMVNDPLVKDIDVVLGAAVGGILLAGAVARILNCHTMFTERVDGAMTLRRGFALQPGDRVLVVEDIVTTGGSVFELLDVVRDSGAILVAVKCLVDRNEPPGIDFGAPGKALLNLPIPAWDPDECPLCEEGLPLIKPGRTGKK